jgi:hypothetical protein
VLAGAGSQEEVWMVLSRGVQACEEAASAGFVVEQLDQGRCLEKHFPTYTGICRKERKRDTKERHICILHAWCVSERDTTHAKCFALCFARLRIAPVHPHTRKKKVRQRLAHLTSHAHACALHMHAHTNMPDRKT